MGDEGRGTAYAVFVHRHPPLTNTCQKTTKAPPKWRGFFIGQNIPTQYPQNAPVLCFFNAVKHSIYMAFTYIRPF
jgi:hypothetical protein